MKLPKQKGAQPRFKPVAQAIQAAMTQRGMDVAALTTALGLTVAQRGAVANWVVGKNGVGPVLRPRVAEVLNLREDQLARSVDARGHRLAPGRLGAAQRAVALVETAKANGELLPPPVAVSDVFTIRVRSDGNMHVRLDASLPFARGMQLAQYLLSFGLVAGAGED